MIGKEHFDPELKNQNFAKYRVYEEMLIAISFSILDYFQKKLTFFRECNKYHFWPFPKKIGQFLAHKISHSCKKSRKTNEPEKRML